MSLPLCPCVTKSLWSTSGDPGTPPAHLLRPKISSPLLRRPFSRSDHAPSRPHPGCPPVHQGPAPRPPLPLPTPFPKEGDPLGPRAHARPQAPRRGAPPALAGLGWTPLSRLPLAPLAHALSTPPPLPFLLRRVLALVLSLVSPNTPPSLSTAPLSFGEGLPALLCGLCHAPFPLPRPPSSL